MQQHKVARRMIQKAAALGASTGEENLSEEQIRHLIYCSHQTETRSAMSTNTKKSILPKKSSSNASGNGALDVPIRLQDVQSAVTIPSAAKHHTHLSLPVHVDACPQVSSEVGTSETTVTVIGNKILI